MKRSIKGKRSGLVLKVSATIALLRHFAEKVVETDGTDYVASSQLSNSNLF